MSTQDPKTMDSLAAQQPSIDFVCEIAEEDTMRVGESDESYYQWGLSALGYIQMVLELANARQPQRILDLPCGHGRVLRMLAASFSGSTVTACDLDRNAVDYCARTFGAKPLYSVEDPYQLDVGDRFDLIWCGSLVTHLNADRWHAFLQLFERILAPRGVLVFTTHGRFFYREIRQGRLQFNVRDTNTLLSDYETAGFGFQPQLHNDRYGISLSTPAWVCNQVGQHRGLRLVAYTERGWRGWQDAVACLREE